MICHWKELFFYTSDQIQHCCIKMIVDITFPKYYHFPAHLLQFLLMLYVIGNIFVELGLPKFHTCLWRCSILATFMSVPETAMNEDYSFILAQYDIWFSRQCFYVFSVAETATKQILTYFNFNRSISTSNLRHIPASLLWRKMVSHYSSQFFKFFHFRSNLFCYSSNHGNCHRITKLLVSLSIRHWYYEVFRESL